jgi:hypothetical protein
MDKDTGLVGVMERSVRIRRSYAERSPRSEFLSANAERSWITGARYTGDGLILPAYLYIRYVS